MAANLMFEPWRVSNLAHETEIQGIVTEVGFELTYKKMIQNIKVFKSFEDKLKINIKGGD